MEEVVGLLLYDRGSSVRIVFFLIPQVSLIMRYSPVAKATKVMLLVEIEIEAISRIAPLSAPDLKAGLRVAGEDSNRLYRIPGLEKIQGLGQLFAIFLQRLAA
jgi:hypothetical protein